MTPLEWRKVDDYHLKTKCGRFSIARVMVCGAYWYVAWRLTQRESEPSQEIAATRLEPDATDKERNETVGSLKALCEAVA
jgi:hypothetical protein